MSIGHSARADTAELVLLHGKVLTVDPKFSVAEAFAVHDGRFVAVGSNEEMRKWINSTTKIYDARGKSVIPGIIDSHVHSAGAAEREAAAPFFQLGSVAEILDWIRERAKTTPTGRWIQVPRHYSTRIRDRRFPTRAELDAAAPDHPVLFDAAYLHLMNTEGLKAAGIGRDTPAPPGGEIMKDAAGEPTGVLRNLKDWVAKAVPSEPADEAAVLDVMERIHRNYLSVGITSVIERGAKPKDVERYRMLRAQDRLRIRASLTILLSPGTTVESAEKAVQEVPYRPGEGDDRLKVSHLKLIVDGGILIGTSYLRAPYGPGAAALYGITDPAYRGAPTLPPEALTAAVRAGHRLGWPMCAHATGDAAADMLLDAFAAADKDASIRDRRFTLIHAYFPDPETARRAASLGVCVDTQPAWYYRDADAITDALGEARLERFVGLAEWLKAGVKLAINTDHIYGTDPDTAINPFNPFRTLHAAVTRKTDGGRVIGPAQRISREQALRAMTIDAAYLSFDETRKGSIETGKLADFAVLSDDYLTCDEDRIGEIKVLATWVEGCMRFER